MARPVSIADSRRLPVIVNIHNVPLAPALRNSRDRHDGGRTVYDGVPDNLTDDHP
jgi:hypothetical protein